MSRSASVEACARAYNRRRQPLTMPFHKGLLPREGFCLDVVLKLIRSTALNPSFLLPFLLLARYTKKGQDLSILHPTANRRLYTFFCAALARVAGNWFSDRVRNNWVADEYDWSKEIVVITGGAGGIGSCMVKLFEEKGVTVVVIDVQPMSFETCKSSSPIYARFRRD